jgi:hypothetical protein
VPSPPNMIGQSKAASHRAWAMSGRDLLARPVLVIASDDHRNLACTLWKSTPVA